MTSIFSLLLISTIANGHILDQRYAEPLTLVEKKLTERQKELGVPGMAIVIVKDDEVIYQGTFGYRDVEKKLPVTSKTLFRIGSITKTFTAFATMMAAEEGKLKLSDHPRRHLPYFKLFQQEANRDVTLGHLLSHSTGLVPYAGDVALLSGKLNREELIRVLGEAKPMAPLGQSFGYSNVAYAAVGEVLRRFYGKPYEEVIGEHILQPLGMTSTTFSLPEMQRSSDHSKGYSPQAPHAELPPQDNSVVSAAGAIDSNLEDMTRFLRLLLNKGELDGKRLLSEAGWNEMIKPRVPIEKVVSSAYGIHYVHFNGAVGNGGNTDGFHSRIGVLPSHNLGFVLLANVTDSALKFESEVVIWQAFAGKDAALPPPLPKPPAPDPAAKFKSSLTAGELARRVAEREGRHSGLRLEYDLEHSSEGIVGKGNIDIESTGGWSSHLRLSAVGKQIAELKDASPDSRSAYVEILRTHRDLTKGDFGWASMLDASGSSISWTGAEIVDKAVVLGEDAFVVVKRSAIGPVREYYSMKSFLLVAREDAAEGMQTFSDYKPVKGWMIPFDRTSVTSSGARSVMRIKTAL